MSEELTAARPYAKAAYETAKADSAEAKWSTALEFMAAVASDPAMQALIDNPGLSADDKASAFIDICKGKIDKKQQNLIKLLAERQRLDALPGMSALFAEYRAEAEGKVDAVVTTAFALTKTQEQKMAAALATRMGCTVKLTSEVDESLVGGAIIRAGDLVIDGSMLSDLNTLSNALTR